MDISSTRDSRHCSGSSSCRRCSSSNLSKTPWSNNIHLLAHFERRYTLSQIHCSECSKCSRLSSNHHTCRLTRTQWFCYLGWCWRCRHNCRVWSPYMYHRTYSLHSTLVKTFQLQLLHHSRKRRGLSTFQPQRYYHNNKRRHNWGRYTILTTIYDQDVCLEIGDDFS